MIKLFGGCLLIFLVIKIISYYPNPKIITKTGDIQFIHIPKTGGTTISYMINDINYKMGNYSIIRYWIYYIYILFREKFKKNQKKNGGLWIILLLFPNILNNEHHVAVNKKDTRYFYIYRDDECREKSLVNFLPLTKQQIEILIKHFNTNNKVNILLRYKMGVFILNSCKNLFLHRRKYIENIPDNKLTILYFNNLESEIKKFLIENNLPVVDIGHYNS